MSRAVQKYSKMNTYLGLITIFLMLGVGSCGEPPEEEIRKLFDECAKESGATPPKGMLTFDDPKMKCFTACMMKKGGTLADGKVIVERVLQNSTSKIPDDIKARITECANKANEETEDCEVSGAYFKCLTEKSRD